MNTKCLIGVTTVLLILFLAPVAEAVPISKEDFTPDAIVIDFDDLSIGEVVDDDYQSLGVTFSGGGVVTFLAPDQVLSTESQIVATFSVNVHRVGLDFSSSSFLTLAAYDFSDNLIDSVTTTTLEGFFGLSTEEMIASVIIHDSGFAFTVDNVTYENPAGSSAPVPEPGTLILLGFGLIGLGAWGLRRKRKG